MPPVQKMSETTEAIAPTIIRIQPTASMSTPLVSPVTPHTRTAPTAMRMIPTVKPAGETMPSLFPSRRKLTGAQRDEDELAGRPPVVAPERVRGRQLLEPADRQAGPGDRRHEPAELDGPAVEVVAAPAEDVVDAADDRVVVVVQEVPD